MLLAEPSSFLDLIFINYYDILSKIFFLGLAFFAILFYILNTSQIFAEEATDTTIFIAYDTDNLNDNDIKTLDAIIKTALRIKEIRANDIRNANKDNINELVDMVSVNNVQYQINNSKNLPIKSNKIA